VSPGANAGDPAPCAAIDLGTNTFLMLVGRVRAGGELEVLEDHCRTPRLGAGLAATGRLSAEAIERGLAVLVEFRDRLRELRIDAAHVRAVGTAALRRASNAAEFVGRTRELAAPNVEIIGEQEEARLGYAAVIADGASPRTAIVDVGGGSTEVVANGGVARISAPIGAVVLTEKCQRDSSGRAWSDTEWRELRREIEVACRAFPENAASSDAGPVIVLGGTGANAVCLELGFARFDPQAAEGHHLPVERIAEWAERLRGLALAERFELPLERERAAILPAGLACLAGALARIGARDVRVTGRGLRYGVLRELCRRTAGA
jgi:exopolyphosphatase/guanosine-5'-triphosphate,3'-diphosphate pyrophosphatase